MFSDDDFSVDDDNAHTMNDLRFIGEEDAETRIDEFALNHPLITNLVEAVLPASFNNNDPAPEWNGRILFTKDTKTKWLVMDGLARAYTSARVYDRIHRGNTRRVCAGPVGRQTCRTVRDPIKIFEMPTLVIKRGANFPGDATLIGDAHGSVYFYETGTVRAVDSPSTVDRYQLNLSTARRNTYSVEVINRLEHGRRIP